MAIFSARADPARGEDAGSALTTPSLRDLMSLARRAAALPGWLRSVKARQRGDYRALLKGRGMEYAESRPYQAGDDVRALDWRLTARLGKPHTKLFREERERPVYVAMDACASMAFATRGVFKRVQAARAAALLGWKAVDNGDRIGGIVFSELVHHEIAPARGSLGAARFLKALVASAEPANGLNGKTSAAAPTPVATALRRLRRLVKPGSLVFVITDGRQMGPAEYADLAGLTRHNDVGLILVYDEFEASLPSLSKPLKVCDARGEFTLPMSQADTQQRYAERFASREGQLATFCRDHRILFSALTTTGDAFTCVQRLLGAR
jgi:uncharacterized protein (DUF58 family)